MGWVGLVVASHRASCHSCSQDWLSPLTKCYPSEVILCRNELESVKERGKNKKKTKKFPHKIHFVIHLKFPSATVSSITWCTLAHFLSLQLFSVLRRSASSFCNTSFGYWSDNQMYLWGIWGWNKAIWYKTLVLPPFPCPLKSCCASLTLNMFAGSELSQSCALAAWWKHR